MGGNVLDLTSHRVMINASAALNCHLLARIYENFMRHTSFKHAVLKSMACPLVAVMLCLCPLHAATAQTVVNQGPVYMGSMSVEGDPGGPGKDGTRNLNDSGGCDDPGDGNPGHTPDSVDLLVALSSEAGKDTGGSAMSVGGNGGSGGSAGGCLVSGRGAGAGGAGSAVNLTFYSATYLSSYTFTETGLYASSVGGNGGKGGTGSEGGNGGNGGSGGDGAVVTVDNSVGIATGQGEGALGIFAQSVGGNGGQGGNEDGTFDGGSGGSGGGGGAGDSVTITNSGAISTPNSIGIFAQSLVVMALGAGVLQV